MCRLADVTFDASGVLWPSVKMWCLLRFFHVCWTCFCLNSHKQLIRRKYLLSHETSWFFLQSSNTLWRFFYTPASFQPFNLRQQVIPLPNPISLGRYSHPILVINIKSIPEKALKVIYLFHTRINEPSWFRAGNSGWMIPTTLCPTFLSPWPQPIVQHDFTSLPRSSESLFFRRFKSI